MQETLSCSSRIVENSKLGCNVSVLAILQRNSLKNKQTNISTETVPQGYGTLFTKVCSMMDKNNNYDNFFF